MTDTPSLREIVARIVDPEAWAAIDDGRDVKPGSLWHLRRDWALAKADQIIPLIEAGVREKLAHVADGIRDRARDRATNAYERGLFDAVVQLAAAIRAKKDFRCS